MKLVKSSPISLRVPESFGGSGKRFDRENSREGTVVCVRVCVCVREEPRYIADGNSSA